ncbi:hypothetical protein ACLOJK_007693 [Asimina triloba]
MNVVSSVSIIMVIKLVISSSGYGFSLSDSHFTCENQRSFTQLFAIQQFNAFAPSFEEEICTIQSLEFTFKESRQKLTTNNIQVPQSLLH